MKEEEASCKMNSERSNCNNKNNNVVSPSHKSTHIGVTSWNVGGINNPIKRYKVLHHLKLLHTHIALLQETHPMAEEHQKLCKDWVGTCYAAPFISHSQGVVILIHKNLNWKLLNKIEDP